MMTPVQEVLTPVQEVATVRAPVLVWLVLAPDEEHALRGNDPNLSSCLGRVGGHKHHVNSQTILGYPAQAAQLHARGPPCLPATSLKVLLTY